MSARFLIFCFLVVVVCAEASGQETRQSAANNSQEAAVVERYSTRVHFENDGTGFEESSAKIRIQSEAGVEQYGQLIFGYNSATEDLDVNYVRVRKPSGQVTETPRGNAQDLALEGLQSAPMYSDYRERHVTVVGLRPGDVLEYLTTKHVTTPLAKGEFWFEYTFPKYLAVMEARLDIEAPKARQLQLKSPSRKFETNDTRGWRTYTWVVRNIVPPRQEPAGEDTESEEAEQGPDVQLTTFTDWRQVANWYARLQGEQVIVDDAVRNKARELTRGATTQTEKTRRLYDFVAKDFRYVSLSFGVGRYQPHPAPEVLKASYGDCKDKHTLLAALLRAADIQSYPVLIGAGRKLDVDVPSPAQFNHVITAVRIDNGLVWLDTTTGVAPFGLITSNLRNQQALIAADDSYGGVRKTPAGSPIKSSLLFSVNGKLSETGVLDAIIDIKATGDEELPWRMVLRSLPQADWKPFAQAAFFNQVGVGEVSDISADPLDDTTKPFHLRYRVHQDNYFRVPGADISYFPFPPLPFPELPKTRSLQPIKIGPAAEMTTQIHLELASNYTVSTPPEIRMTRDYAEYKASYQVRDNLFDAERKLNIKMDELPPERRADVESLRNIVMNVPAQSVSFSIRRASPAAQQAAVVPSGSDSKSLREAATRALQQGDFKAASALLKRFVEQEPASRDAWDELGRAALAMNDHEAALQAFKKQVEINPFHKTAYDDLGWELQQEGKNEEAIGAYRKQLENVPLDRFARKSLGLLLLQLKRDKEARSELEAAASVPPGDAEIDLALARLYWRDGDTQRARPLLIRIVGKAAPFPKGDIYAAALRDDIDSAQTLRDAHKMVDDIEGEQLDSEAYTGAAVDGSSAMQFVALGWARVGWAKFLQGEVLEGRRYLNASWTLCQSGTAANRLARLSERAGQAANAKDLLALAVAAGGEEAESSRAQLLKLDPGGADFAITRARRELSEMSSIKIASLSQKSGSAEFTLIFDGSNKPDRVEYRAGDEELRSANQALASATYPVVFPEVSSLKIVRQANLSCSSSGCWIILKPVAAPGIQEFVGDYHPSELVESAPKQSPINEVSPPSGQGSEGPTVFKVESGVTAPRPIFNPEPRYPTKAREDMEEGAVKVRMVVGSDGLVRDARVVQSASPDFDQNAIEAVLSWRFEPATKDGKPVAVEVIVVVNFKLH